MIKRLVIVTMVLIIVTLNLALTEETKWIVVRNVKKLKGIKAEKITWQKDDAKKVRIPKKFKRTTHNELSNLVSQKKETMTNLPDLSQIY